MSKNQLLLLATVTLLWHQPLGSFGAEPNQPALKPQAITGIEKSLKAEKSMQKEAAAELHKMFSGLASYYSTKLHGRRTASGAPYDQTKLTCAHRSLPFGTKLLVQNPANGKSCVVMVNDRGPFHTSRVMDLSGAAAKILGIKGVSNIVCYSGGALDNQLAGQHALTNISSSALLSSADQQRH